MSQYDNPSFDDHDIEIDLTPPSVGAQYHPAETEDLLLTLRDLIENARDVPLSASSMIVKDEVLVLLDEALESLPEELRAARWLLKEREEFLARTRHEADDVIEQARTRAERMVQRTEVVKAAEQRAYDIVDAAQADARRLRHEVEDFCDQKLASCWNVRRNSLALAERSCRAPIFLPKQRLLPNTASKVPPNRKSTTSKVKTFPHRPRNLRSTTNFRNLMMRPPCTTPRAWSTPTLGTTEHFRSTTTTTSTTIVRVLP